MPAPAGEAENRQPPPPEPVWVAKAQRAVPPADPNDPFSVGSVTEVEVRLYNDRTDYRLTVVEAGVEETLWTGRDREGWGAALAMKRIRVDKECGLHADPPAGPGAPVR